MAEEVGKKVLAPAAVWAALALLPTSKKSERPAE